MLEAASVHGRFQPFHNEHLDYTLAAKKLCKFLWVGITKFDVTPTDASPLGRHRERPENNPFTYFERISMIAAALVETGIDRGSFGFVPFPIETPKRLSEFMPTSIPCYTTVCEEWNREKIHVLRAYGYQVEVLWERDKTVTGSKIREDILLGGNAWRSMVPTAVGRQVDSLNIRERLAQLGRLSDEKREGR